MAKKNSFVFARLRDDNNDDDDGNGDCVVVDKGNIR